MAVLAHIDWHLILRHLLLLVFAYALAVPVGWNREREARGAGLRTFPLVALGSCGYVLIGLSVLHGSASQSRILYGLMTGIGFIGGGAILKGRDAVHGTATAASIWITGAIGAAVAWGRYEIAIVLSVLNFATLRVGTSFKGVIRRDGDGRGPD